MRTTCYKSCINRLNETTTKNTMFNFMQNEDCGHVLIMLHTISKVFEHCFCSLLSGVGSLDLDTVILFVGPFTKFHQFQLLSNCYFWSDLNNDKLPILCAIYIFL